MNQGSVFPFEIDSRIRRHELGGGKGLRPPERSKGSLWTEDDYLPVPNGDDLRDFRVRMKSSYLDHDTAFESLQLLKQIPKLRTQHTSGRHGSKKLTHSRCQRSW